MKSTQRTIKRILAAVFVLILLLTGVFIYLSVTMDRSGWAQENGQYFYYDTKGRPVTGWQEIDGCRYYFDAGGVMLTGRQVIDGETYFFSGGGVRQTGWVEYEGSRFWLNVNGNPVNGWQEIDGERRYFLADGALAVGWQTVDGMRCYMTEEGTLTTGWLHTESGSYYFSGSGALTTGLTQIDGSTYYFYEGSGLMHQGWLDLNGSRYYFTDEGAMAVGWQTADGLQCYFGEDGAMVTGWLTDGEYRYYLLEDGGLATSPTVIDGETCFFTPDGIYVLLVNYQYALPADYSVELVRYGEWARVASIVEEHLRQMILDCRATGIDCWLNSGYRTQDEQTTILNERTQTYQEQGMSYDAARAKALETVAVPGYSEHQTGLAVDVVCSVTPTWLQEHCWEYGFILRYPEDKSDITGIAYEHWHFRYVGTKVSMAMKDTGLCLEEYLGAA